jgi:hypothetical protein
MSRNPFLLPSQSIAHETEDRFCDLGDEGYGAKYPDLPRVLLPPDRERCR